MRNNNKRIFMEFVLTYFAIIGLVLVCLFPVFASLEHSKRDKVTQMILDYGQSNANALETNETRIFHTVRNFYSGQELQQFYYSSTRTAGTTLFYNMTQLQKQLKLHFMNISGIKDIIVYIPKFDYVLTEDYIFKTRDQFYEYSRLDSFPASDWLTQVYSPDYNLRLMADQFTDFLDGGKTYPVMNQFFVFPMTGDVNVRIMVVVAMDPREVAGQLLLPDIRDQAYAVIKDKDGNTLAEYLPIEQDNASVSLSDRKYETLTFSSEGGKQITIGIDNRYYADIRRECLRSILLSIVTALCISACAALFFSWNRSRPIERILGIIRKANLAECSDGKLGEIEDTVINMVTEIRQCQATIRDLDSMVSNSLLERLFFGELPPGKPEEAFVNCYGPMPSSAVAVVMAQEKPGEELIFKEIIQNALPAAGLEIYAAHSRKSKIYLLLPESPDIQKLLEQTLKVMREINGSIVKAGISNPITSIQAVKEGARQAERRLDAGFHMQGIYLFAHTYSSKATPLLNVQSLDSLQRTLLSGNKPAADKIIGELFDHVEAEKPEAVELRQLFFSLRSVYSIVINQFRLEAERSGISVCEWLHLPNDLDEYSPLTVKTAFTELNEVIYDYYQKYIARSSRIKGLDILAYVEKNYRDSNLCASSIATHFNLSEKYVFQLVKGACRETLNDKISSLRVQEGIRLLESTDMSVADIALKAGFTSANSMYKVFMRITGISPSAYRKKNK